MSALVVDSFLRDPKAEREKALRAKYETLDRMGFDYPGVSLVDDDATIEEVNQIGDLIGHKLKLHKAMYRRYTESELGPTYIHSDVQIGHYSAILFLNKSHQCDGGTAFWRHKGLGLDANPTEAQLLERGIKPSKEVFDQIHQDGFNESKWEMTELIDMKFNRLFVFPSALYHSRYPFTPFGDKTENARLIKVYFMVLNGVDDPLIR